MITIITGKKGAGKTTYLEKWYNENPEGVGFLTQKVYDSTQCIGYDLVRLPDRKSIPLIRLLKHQSQLSDIDLIYQNRFVFSQKAFHEANQWLLAQINSNKSPIWLDEIGKQELSNEGFDATLRQALSQNIEARLVFRLKHFDELIKNYQITEYRKIHCKPKS